VDRAGIFHRLPRLDDARLAEIFGREVLALLVGKGLLSPEWAERVGKYMIRPVLALERLLFLDRVGKMRGAKKEILLEVFGDELGDVLDLDVLAALVLEPVAEHGQAKGAGGRREFRA